MRNDIITLFRTLVCKSDGTLRGLFCSVQCPQGFTAENVKRFIEDLAFLLSYDSAPRPPLTTPPPACCLPFSVFCVSPVELTNGRGGGGGCGTWVRNQIIRPRESLALYKSSLVYWQCIPGWLNTGCNRV
jgi:hypothetical protein